MDELSISGVASCQQESAQHLWVRPQYRRSKALPTTWVLRVCQEKLLLSAHRVLELQQLAVSLKLLNTKTLNP